MGAITLLLEIGVVAFLRGLHPRRGEAAAPPGGYGAGSFRAGWLSQR